MAHIEAPFEWWIGEELEKMTKIGNAIVLGDRSDIAQSLIPKLRLDGWNVDGWNRDTESLLRFPSWDLILCALGTVAPVGRWQDISSEQWHSCMTSNLTLPFQLIQDLWYKRRPNASVCFMAGSNPNKITPGYTAYNVSKMALLKLCEQLDIESPEVKFFALGPGYVETKIHKPTLDSGIKNERIERGGSTPIEAIYDCLKWCLIQPKEVVGGRNICVSDPRNKTIAQTDGHAMMFGSMADALKADPSMYKLRRYESS